MKPQLSQHQIHRPELPVAVPDISRRALGKVGIDIGENILEPFLVRLLGHVITIDTLPEFMFFGPGMCVRTVAAVVPDIKRWICMQEIDFFSTQKKPDMLWVCGI